MGARENGPKLSIATKFVVSGASGISGWLVVHPMDVLKVRMQLDTSISSTRQQAINLLRNEGVPGLYKGLSAAIMRQASYTTLRLGLYDIIKDIITSNPNHSKPTLPTRIMSGMVSGAVASFICCPVEVCLIRMQADGRLPVDQRRGYTHVGNALLRIAREEGWMTYWRGSGPTVARAMVVSMTQLATYDQAKSTLLEKGVRDGVPLHFASSLIAGFIYSMCSLPLDTIKTRMQDHHCSKTVRNTSSMRTAIRIVNSEGIFALWNGFWPYFGRGGGHTIFMFLFLEQFRRMAYSF